MNRKILSSTALALILCFTFSLTAAATMSTAVDAYINITSLPEDAIVDILVEDVKIKYDDLAITAVEQQEIDIHESALYKYYEDGYLALNLRDENIRFNYKEDENGIYAIQIVWGKFVPKDFAIIVQTTDNQINVSNKVTFKSRRNFEEYFYDFNENVLIEGEKTRKGFMENRSLLFVLVLPFLIFILAMLLIEFAFIKLFKVKAKFKTYIVLFFVDVFLGFILLYLYFIL